MKTLSIILVSALALSFIASCTSTSTDPLAPTPTMAKQSGTPIDDLGKGHAIFLRQCSQCHEQRVPNAIPTKEWHLIVPGMAWNAGLSKEEERLVTEYVVAASKVKSTATQ